MNISITFLINKYITIKLVPEYIDIIHILEVYVCSSICIGTKTAISWTEGKVVMFWKRRDSFTELLLCHVRRKSAYHHLCIRIFLLLWRHCRTKHNSWYSCVCTKFVSNINYLPYALSNNSVYDTHLLLYSVKIIVNYYKKKKRKKRRYSAGVRNGLWNSLHFIQYRMHSYIPIQEWWLRARIDYMGHTGYETRY